MSDENSKSEPSQTTGRSGRGWMPIAAAVVLLGGGAAAWQFGLIGRAPIPAEGSVEQPKEPIYYTLDENLVVNFRGTSGPRYLQVGVELMTYDAKAVAALETHAPVIRNNLIMLLGDQSAEDLQSRDGKEALRSAALAEVQSSMETLHGSAGVESLYFTTFVMQ